MSTLQDFRSNQLLRSNNDQYPSSYYSSGPSDKNKEKEDGKERQDFPSSTNSGYFSDSLLLPGCMMGSNPPYSVSPMCFSQGSMNMMDSSQIRMSSMGYNSFWSMNAMGMMPGPRPTSTIQKEILKFKSSILYPPPPGSKLPSTRQCPPGCRTIFVGSLPENITEEHLREIFERSGEICSIRVSKKNFAHIRFTFQASVEQALYISGYCMKIDNKDDKPNYGRLHVDYATAQDDHYEYNCQQRQLARELRHRRKLEEERLRPPSPPLITDFTESEASLLQEKLKNDETVSMAVNILITWFERGNCNRKSVNTFYSLLQTVNSNVRRLLSEKDALEGEIRKLQEKFQKRFSVILSQFEEIEKVFTTACKQKSWDHFSKAQRKNIDLWFKQIKETNIAQQEEFFNDFQDDSMDISDGEDGEPETSAEPPTKKKKSEIDVNLRYENDDLKCQVEAYKNEIDMAKQEALNSLEMKDKQIKSFQLALQGMQQQLISSRQLSDNSEKSSSLTESTDDKKNLQKQLEEKDKEIQALQLALEGIRQNKQSTATFQENTSNSIASTPEHENDSVHSVGQSISSSISTISPYLTLTDSQKMNSNDFSFSEYKVKLIGLISCFLNVHPMGASPDYIWSYLNQMQLPVRASEIEELLEKLPSLFKLETSGCGASLERRWKFTGFNK